MLEFTPEDMSIIIGGDSMDKKRFDIADNSGKEFIVGFTAGLICLGSVALALLIAICL